MADSLLDLKTKQNSTIYNLPTDTSVVKDDLLLIARPNYKNKYTKRIDKEFPYESFNSTIAQLSAQTADMILKKNEIVTGKWYFNNLLVTTSNVQLAGDVPGKAAATKWYVDHMYEAALKKLYELSAYIYDIDHPHIPSYPGMVITTSISQESKIKEIYGGSKWQLTCQNKFLVGVNDYMNNFGLESTGGHNSIKLTINQSPITFHEHKISSTVSRTFKTRSYGAVPIAQAKYHHRKHSWLHDFLVAAGLVIAFVATVVVSAILIIGSGGTLAGPCAAMASAVGETCAVVIGSLIVGAIAVAMGQFTAWALTKFTEFSASAIKNIVLGAQITAVVASFFAMYFGMGQETLLGVNTAQASSAATETVAANTAAEAMQNSTTGLQSTSLLRQAVEHSFSMGISPNAASAMANASAPMTSVGVLAGADGGASIIAESLASSVSTSIAQIAPGAASAMAGATGSLTSASSLASLGADSVVRFGSAAASIMSNATTTGVMTSLLKAAVTAAANLPLAATPIAASASLSLAPLIGGTATNLIGLSLYSKRLSNHFVPSTPYYQLKGKESLDYYNSHPEDFAKLIKDLVNNYNKKYNINATYAVDRHPTSVKIGDKTYQLGNLEQTIAQAVNDISASYDNAVYGDANTHKTSTISQSETNDDETQTAFNNREDMSESDIKKQYAYADLYKCPNCNNFSFLLTNRSTKQCECLSCNFKGVTTDWVPTQAQVDAYQAQYNIDNSGIGADAHVIWNTNKSISINKRSVDNKDVDIKDICIEEKTEQFVSSEKEMIEEKDDSIKESLEKDGEKQIRSTDEETIKADKELFKRADTCPNTENGEHVWGDGTPTDLDTDNPNPKIAFKCEKCGKEVSRTMTLGEEEYWFKQKEDYNAGNAVDPRTSFGTASLGVQPIGVSIGYVRDGLTNCSELQAKSSIDMRPKYFGLYMWKRIS